MCDYVALKIYLATSLSTRADRYVHDRFCAHALAASNRLTGVQMDESISLRFWKSHLCVVRLKQQTTAVTRIAKPSVNLIETTDKATRKGYLFQGSTRKVVEKRAWAEALVSEKRFPVSKIKLPSSLTVHRAVISLLHSLSFEGCTAQERTRGLDAASPAPFHCRYHNEYHLRRSKQTDHARCRARMFRQRGWIRCLATTHLPIPLQFGSPRWSIALFFHADEWLVCSTQLQNAWWYGSEAGFDNFLGKRISLPT